MTLNLPPSFPFYPLICVFLYPDFIHSLRTDPSDACRAASQHRKPQSRVIRSDTHTRACPRDGRPPAATGNTRCPSAAPRPEAGEARASSEGWSCL